MIVAARAGNVMLQSVPVVDTLAEAFARALNRHQLRRLGRHVSSGTSVCCGPTADFFVHSKSMSAAPEVLANVENVPWRKFSCHTAEVPDRWCETFGRLCIVSGGCRPAFSFERRDLARGVSLWNYTIAIRSADIEQVRLAVSGAIRIAGVKF